MPSLTFVWVFCRAKSLSVFQAFQVILIENNMLQQPCNWGSVGKIYVKRSPYKNFLKLFSIKTSQTCKVDIYLKPFSSPIPLLHSPPIVVKVF